MEPKRILVADDEAHMARVIELFLRREGYAVEVVRDGREALESILRKTPDALVSMLAGDFSGAGDAGSAVDA